MDDKALVLGSVVLEGVYQAGKRKLNPSDKSLYWYNIWLKEGRPSQGWLHSTVVRKRTQYHYAVRRLRRRADHLRAENFLRLLCYEMLIF